MNTAIASIQDHLTDLADPTRGRILLALETHQLSVAELQAMLQLPQSTVSRHLKTLADGGWVDRREEGPSNRYRLDDSALAQPLRELWGLVREEVARSGAAQEDRRRLQAVLAQRHTRSRAFFASEAGRWDRLREDLFGQRPELLALLGLLDPSWVVADLGCGTGQLVEAIAPFVRRVVAVDESAEMLEAAGRRLAGYENVEIRQGELELLPVGEAELDLVVVALVLPYVPEPGRVLAEAGRALQPGGRVLIVDLQPHQHADYEQTMGHIWLGFSPAQIQEWLMGAGLRDARVLSLAPDPAGKGPGLFVASARKPD